MGTLIGLSLDLRFRGYGFVRVEVRSDLQALLKRFSKPVSYIFERRSRLKCLRARAWTSTASHLAASVLLLKFISVKHVQRPQPRLVQQFHWMLLQRVQPPAT